MLLLLDYNPSKLAVPTSEAVGVSAYSIAALVEDAVVLLSQ